MKRLGRIVATMLVASAVMFGLVATASAATAAPQTATATPNAVKRCDSSTVNWAATYPTYGDWLAGRNASHCIGGRGTWNVPANATEVFCAGNNHGHFWWHNLDTGAYGSANFSSDRSYSVGMNNAVMGANVHAARIYVYKVRIDGWTGSAGC